MDGVVILHIADKDRNLYDIPQGSACCFERGLHVFEHRLCLKFHVTLADNVTVRVHRDHSRDVDGASCWSLHSGGERSAPRWGRELGTLDHLSSHYLLPLIARLALDLAVPHRSRRPPHLP